VHALQEADANVRMAKVRRFNAQQALINLGLPISIEGTNRLSDDELAEKLHFLGLPPDVVRSLDSETASANLIPLVSSLDGTVIDREIVIGEVVDSGKVQFIVADMRRMWLLLDVRKEDAGELKVGQPVLFSCSGVAGEVQSRISWIATEADPRTRTIQVRAEVENTLAESSGDEANCGNWLLRANLFGSARIRVREQPSAIVVPSSAVQWDGEQHLVFLPEGDGTMFYAQNVQVGVARDGYTEIRSGLSPGQSIVADGSYALKSEYQGIEN
jgi:cobalt-zinc-cadmium efflux system membrane fusion protein